MTLDEPKTYALRTVEDFLAIPWDKQDACLIDFAAWLDLVRGAQAVIARQPETIKFRTSPDVFGWIDDGKHIATVTVQHGERVIARDEIEFAPPESK